MTENNLFDACRMFKHACAFADCAQYCETENNNIEYRLQSHTVSGIVNSAFSCEIFIKSLLIFHGKSLGQIKGHELKVLWKKYKDIDNSKATIIENKMLDWFGKSHSDDLFDKFLSEASDAFEHWRYIYEYSGGKLNINFLRGFRELLRELCCKEFYGKSWKDYIDSSR